MAYVIGDSCVAAVPAKDNVPLAQSAWATANSKSIPASASTAVLAQDSALLALFPKAESVDLST